MEQSNLCSEDSEDSGADLGHAEEEEDDEKRWLVPPRTRVSVRGDGWRSCQMPSPPVVLLPARQPE